MATLSTPTFGPLSSDPPFLLRHPRARRGMFGWLRAEPPRAMPHLEPVLDEPPPHEPEPEPVPATLPEPVARAPELVVLPEPLPAPEPPLRVTTIELPAYVEPPEPPVLAPALLGPLVPASAVVEPVIVGAPPGNTVAAPAEESVVLPRRRGWTRRIVGGLLSAAAYVAASLMLLAAGPVYLVMSDRQDVVRWSNDLLDLLARW